LLPITRQFLSRDESRSPEVIVEQLAGMNAQTKRGPCVGLWTRSASYNHDEYLRALGSYELVRANLMRGTVHLVTRRQYLAWRSCMQPVAQKMVRQFCPTLQQAADLEAVLEGGSELLRAEPGLTRSQIGTRLAPRFPEARPSDLGFAVRMLLPVVEVASLDPWTASRTAYVLAETVFDQPPASAETDIADMVRSFFAAYGPATAADFCYWSGFTNAQAAAGLREAGLTASPLGREQLLDVSQPLHVPAREAFVLPEFDNLLFCRKNDSSLAEAKRALIYPPAQMHGCVMTGDIVVADWSAKSGEPSRTDWQAPQPAVADEWQDFAQWYRSM
jgi:hypothetical protein